MRDALRVCLDLDATLNDLIHRWMVHMRETEIWPEASLKNLEYYGFMHDAFGFNGDLFWKRPETYDMVRPLPGAVSFVRRLVELGHEVVVVTHTPDGQSSRTKDNWVAKNLPFDLPVIHAAEKWKVTNGSLLVDDCPRHVYHHCLYNDMPGFIYNHAGEYGWARELVKHELVTVTNSYAQVLGGLTDVVARYRAS